MNDQNKKQNIPLQRIQKTILAATQSLLFKLRQYTTKVLLTYLYPKISLTTPLYPRYTHAFKGQITAVVYKNLYIFNRI